MQVVFSTSLGIFVSDGTETGTSLVATLPDPAFLATTGPFASVGAKVVFSYQDGIPPYVPSLWVTDGTAGGTALIDSLPDESSGDSFPALFDLVSLGDVAVFVYPSAPLYPFPPPSDNNLWTTDGTSGGTVNLAVAGIDNPILDPSGLLSDHRLVFTDAYGLDVTDGTVSGTMQIKSGSFGHGAYPFGLASLGSIVVFDVASMPDDEAAGGDQLWRTDGTPSGTVLVTSFPFEGANSFFSMGSKALFAYIDGSAPFLPSLWVTDGTAAGTFALPGITDPQFGAMAGSRAILISAEGLVATDGTVADTQVIMPKSLGPNGFGPTTIMASLGNEVVFAAAVPTSLNNPYVYGSTNQLWETDGTTAGTRLIEVLPTYRDFVGISSMTSVDGRVLFTYGDGVDDPGVWTTDGTAAGTTELIDNANAYFRTGSVAELIPPCFASGSLIAVQGSAKAVEHLQVGDRVVTVTGSVLPIRWIGYRQVNCHRHPEPERVWPIRIAAHAFGAGRPERALLLSPDHSVFVEDVLIPIKFLVNGTTIRQVGVDSVTYYHVELARHDILLAEGLLVESYLETGGRAAFANAGDITELHPNFTPDEARVGEIWRTRAYAPLLGDGDQLVRARTKLLVQASMLGCSELMEGDGARRGLRANARSGSPQLAGRASQ